jgi:transmembrane sensor
MNKSPDRSTKGDPHRLSREACQWVVDLDESPGEASLARFREWLAGDPARSVAFEAARADWHRMDAVRSMPAVLARLEIAAADPARQSLPAPPLSPVRWWPGRRQLLAGAVTVVLAVLSIGMWQRWWIVGPEEFRTARGEIRLLQLPDGSTAHMNTASRMTLTFTGEARRIDLLEGEVVFDVRHERYRPFVVRAGSRVVRAIGTNFAVLHDGPRLQVTVVEGRVDVALLSSEEHGHARTPADASVFAVRAGESFSSAAGTQQIGTVRKLDSTQLERQLSWEHGRLIFEGEALQDVVTELNRYSRQHIVLANEHLGTIRVGAVFSTSDIDGALAILGESLSLRIVHVSPLVTLIAPADQAAPRSEIH